MQVLNRDSLPLGGFAGLTEHRLVTDHRIFGQRKKAETWNGIGNFVYLADAKFNPLGETHMHPHKEIDVITVMVDGKVSHEGSLEHGQSLSAGEVQVQRAGGEGFSHNEINPDNKKNRLLQIWVLPEVAGERAGYKLYPLSDEGITRIYGGTHNQQDTFASKTTIDIVRLTKGQNYHVDSNALVYVTKGQADFTDEKSRQEGEIFQAQEGDLINSYRAEINASAPVELVVICEA